MRLFFTLDLSFMTFFRKVIFLPYEKTYAKISSQIYQEREGPNPSGGFEFGKTKGINQQII